MSTCFIKKLFVVGALLSMTVCLPANDWLTFGKDAQRTGWARDEGKLTKETVSGLKLLHRIKLDNQPRFMTGLTAPVVMEAVVIPQNSGTFTDVAIIGGASDKIFAVSADLGEIVWQREFSVVDNPKIQGDILCPKALNATPVIEGIGWMENFVYALASDGKLYTINIHTGRDAAPPLQFTPPFAKPWSLNLVHRVLYTTTSQGCGNNSPSIVYALDLKDSARTVKRFLATPTGGAGIWGRAGAAIGPDGTVYIETGDGPTNPAQQMYSNAVVALAPETVALRDYYIPANFETVSRRDWDMSSMSPVVFPFLDRWIVAASGKEGVLYLLDAAKLGGDDHHTPLFRSPLYANEKGAFSGHGMWGAFAAWQNAAGESWLAVPAWGPVAQQAPKFAYTNGPISSGAIMTFNVALDEATKQPTLVPIWTSPDMHVPEPPVVTGGGVLFALANGANVGQMLPSGEFDGLRHEKPAGSAVLLALDAYTGKELWSSKDIMKGSWTHFSGLAIANGRVFVTTHDGTVWIFGLE